MITIIVVMIKIPRLHRVELFLLTYWTQLGITLQIKMRVDISNKTIGKPIAIDNSIKQKLLFLI